MTGLVPVWRVRLSEGWCPREGHQALQVPDDPGWHGHGYCTECQVGWLMVAGDFTPGEEYLSVRCWEVLTTTGPRHPGCLQK